MMPECIVSSTLSPDNHNTNPPRSVKTTLVLDAVPSLTLPPMILRSHGLIVVCPGLSPSGALPSQLQPAAQNMVPGTRRSFPPIPSPVLLRNAPPPIYEAVRFRVGPLSGLGCRMGPSTPLERLRWDE